MHFHKYTNSDGSIQAYINMDTVISAQPNDDNTVTLYMFNNDSIDVSQEQFKEAIKNNNGANLISDKKLIDAINNLSLRIPNSIRMHL